MVVTLFTPSRGCSAARTELPQNFRSTYIRVALKLSHCRFHDIVRVLGRVAGARRVEEACVEDIRRMKTPIRNALAGLCTLEGISRPSNPERAQYGVHYIPMYSVLRTDIQHPETRGLTPEAKTSQGSRQAVQGLQAPFFSSGGGRDGAKSFPRQRVGTGLLVGEGGQAGTEYSFGTIHGGSWMVGGGMWDGEWSRWFALYVHTNACTRCVF